MRNLAELFFAMGRYTETEPLLKGALEILRKTLGPKDLETVTALNDLGTLYVETGDYAEAEPLLQQVLEARKAGFGPEHPETAKILNTLAGLYTLMGQYAKAEPFYLGALRIREKVLGTDHPETADSLNDLGALYAHTGQYAKAEQLYQKALEIRIKVHGEEHPDTAISLNNLGRLYDDMGQYAKAEPLFQRALQIRRKLLGPEHPQTATALNNLGLLYAHVGDYEKAESFYQQALQISRKVLGEQNSDVATSLNNLGSLHQDLGEYGKAEAFYRQALEMLTKVVGPEHPLTAATWDNLALLHFYMNDYANAELFYQKSLTIRVKVLGRDHPDTAKSLNNLALLYERGGNYAAAEQLYQRALEIDRVVFGPENPNTALSLNNLASLYDQMGDYLKAKPLFEQALEISNKVLGPEHVATAMALNNLALVYDHMGSYDKAEPLLEQALQIIVKLIGPEHPTTSECLRNLAALKFEVGQIPEAKSLEERSAKAYLAALSTILSFTSEQQRLDYQDRIDPYSLFAILPGSEMDLTEAILRYKGVVLDSFIEDRLLAEASQGSEHQNLAKQLNLDRRQLGQLYLQPPPNLSKEANQQIDALEGEIERIESQLAQHFAGLGRVRRALGVSLEQVQPTIPNDGTLIEYLRYWHFLGKGKFEQRYGAIVLSSKGAPLWIPLGKANELEHLVRRYGTLVRDSPEEEELSANLQALYEILWAPIGKTLPSQTKRIIISPDGELNFISFATLLTKDKQFLAERYNVQYVASGRDLLREFKPSTAKEVVLFANPDFGLASTAMLAKADNGSFWDIEDEIAGLHFDSLDGTQKERDELIKKFAGWAWAPTDFTGKEATKEALLKIHSPYILHLATHGFFAKEDPTTTQTEPDTLLKVRQGVTKSKFFKNPMHRSGLALAGAQTTIEAWKRDEVPPVENDGILTAEDVSTLDLQGTWLVTLSACDTGSGEARAGEGVMGLRRGFMQAGAQNTLMTLWKIRDEFAPQIMSDFYEAAHNSGNAPEALAAVQRRWLVKLRTEKGLAQAVNLAGPFIMSSQGKP